MHDLAAFLNARLDEDEAVAQMWRKRDLRPLREVEAKRAIVAEHAPTDWQAYGDHMCRRCIYSDHEPHDELHQWVPFPCLTVRQLAAVYSDHPDYRQEWKP